MLFGPIVTSLKVWKILKLFLPCCFYSKIFILVLKVWEILFFKQRLVGCLPRGFWLVSWHSKVRSWIECAYLKKHKIIYWKLPLIKKCQFSLGFGLFLEIGSSNFNSDFTVVTCQSKLYGETPHMPMFKKTLFTLSTQKWKFLI